MKSAVIIGGGPSGCECALWLKLFGHESIIVEKNDRLGGLLTLDFNPGDGIVGVRNLSCQEVAHNMQVDISANDIPFLVDSCIERIEHISSGYRVFVGLKVIETHFLVIASGTIASDGGFSQAENFIIGPGALFAKYDFAGKHVAVLGGSEYACMSYVSIKERGGALCHVYARTLKAQKKWRERIDPADLKLFPYQVDQASMSVTYQNEKHAYDVFVVMYGWKPNFPEVLASLKDQLVDADEYIITDPECRTPVSGIYAIGDITRRMYPCLPTALADGVVAAKSIQKTLDAST